MKSFLFLLAFSFGLSAFATEAEVVWLRIDTQYTYQDSNQHCTTKHTTVNTHTPGEAYLAMEVVEGKAVGARFSNYPNAWPFKWIYKAIDLNADEINSLKLFKDKKGHYWIKRFTLSERLAKWLIYYPAERHFWCKVTSVPREVTSGVQSVIFETEGLEIGVGVSYSDSLKLEGFTSQGDPFEETLKIVQRTAEKEFP